MGVSLTTVISCLFATHTAGASAPHPMDALDASEIVAAVALLRGAGHADKATLFSSITLREPRKETVLAWRKGKPIPRAANVVLRKGSKTYEAVVDLGRREVASFREVPGAVPILVLPDLIAGIEAALGDSRMQEGLRKRGIADFEQLCCFPRTVGNFGREAEQTRRIVKVDTKEVIEVTDTGVVPIPPGRPGLDPDSIGNMREVKPMYFSAPQGSNFTVEWLDGGMAKLVVSHSLGSTDGYCALPRVLERRRRPSLRALPGHAGRDPRALSGSNDRMVLPELHGRGGVRSRHDGNKALAWIRLPRERHSSLPGDGECCGRRRYSREPDLYFRAADRRSTVASTRTS